MEILIMTANLRKLAALSESTEDVQESKIVNKLQLEKPVLKDLMDHVYG